MNEEINDLEQYERDCLEREREAFIQEDLNTMNNEQHNEEENVLTSELCDLYDVRMFLRLRGLLDEPKDNEGTEETIGELIDNLIEQHNQ